MHRKQSVNMRLLLFWILYFNFCYGLNILEVSIPGYKARGESATLECRYKLNGDSLYSVKWYKDNEEFYRYMPKLSPPQHSYKVEGVKVDMAMSNDKKVLLKGLTLKASGVYKCEVSAEAPGFTSASGEGRMEVVYLPQDGPYISSADREYQTGDVLNLNCTSGKSFPAPILHWYVNDDKITSRHELILYEVTKHQHGLETSTLGLQLNVASHHLRGGELRIRCVASPPWPISLSSSRAAPLTDNREALLLVKSGSNCLQKKFFLVVSITVLTLTFYFYIDHENHI